MNTEACNDPTIIDTPYKIHLYSLLCMKYALKLECKGLKMSRGQTRYSYLKKHYGFKGNKDSVLAQFSQYIVDFVNKNTVANVS